MEEKSNITTKSLTLEEELVALQGNLRNFALALTMDSADADDLVQDTILKVLYNQDKFVNNVNFKGWVLTIMKNIFINNYRKTSRNKTSIDRSEDLFQLNMPQSSGYETPDGAYSISEISSNINSFEDQYSVLLAMHIKGYKYEEIAAQTGLPLGTIKNRIFIARKRLQERLVDYR